MKMLKHTLRQLFRQFSPPPGVIPKSRLRPFLPANPVIIDAGAHIGSDTIEMSRLWKQARIFAFEPVPSLFAQLQTNTRECPNVQCFQIALGAQTGEQTMFVSSGASDGSSSLLQPTGHLIDHPDTFFKTAITVPTMTLDDWARAHNIAAVDLLWLDLQGFELAVMRAAPQMMRTVRAIHTEVSVREQYASAPLYPQVRAWLAEQGLRVQVAALPPSWDGGNVLFVRG